LDEAKRGVVEGAEEDAVRLLTGQDRLMVGGRWGEAFFLFDLQDPLGVATGELVLGEAGFESVFSGR
jgi:hypothetical protein